MKVAIVHDVFIEFGGAERVLLALLDIYSKADVYIPLLSGMGHKELQQQTKGKIFTSLLNHIPFIHSASILLKPLLCLYWEQLDLKAYDLVISSSHSFSSKSVITHPKTLHVSYIHTTPRYLYAEYNETQIIKKPLFRFLLSPLLSWLRVRDFIGGQRPDVLIANSKTVQARIRKYYRRESTVIYPPVEIPKRLPKRNPRYYLCVSRLSKQKGIDLAIHACNKLKAPLVVVGEGSQETYLRSIAGPTVEFRGRVPNEDMADVYAGAKALIFPAIDEDFGMVPVEAMAHGVPVIGHNSGGTAETVINGKTGLLFNDWSTHSLTRAIEQLGHRDPFDSRLCRRQAVIFSISRFTESIQNIIREQLIRKEQ